MAVRPPTSDAGNELRKAAQAADAAQAAAQKAAEAADAVNSAAAAAQAAEADRQAKQQNADDALARIGAGGGNGHTPPAFIPAPAPAVTIHQPNYVWPAAIIAAAIVAVALILTLFWCWHKPAVPVAAPVAAAPVAPIVVTAPAADNKEVVAAVKAVGEEVKSVGGKVDALAADAKKGHAPRAPSGSGNSAEAIASAVAAKLQASTAGSSSTVAIASAYAIAKAYGAPPEGCNVKLEGVVFKELAPRANATCAGDRALIVDKFRAQCYGKKGSDAADRACGALLTLD